MTRRKKTKSGLEERFGKGTVVEATVTRVTPFAILVEVGQGIQGIIRKRELSWGPEPEHPQEVAQLGDVLKTRVVGSDSMGPRLELSLRQAVRDPWHKIDKRYRVGQTVRCRVEGLVHKGAFLELEQAVSGFVPLHEVCEPPPEKIEAALWKGDTVEAVITRIDPVARQIELSIRQRLRALKAQRAELIRYRYNDDEGGVPLGERLSDEGRRALFNVLPRQEAWPSAPAQAESAPHALAATFRRILVADNDKSFLASLELLLGRLGHEVTTADNVPDALRLCAEREFDLCLFDLSFTPGGLEGLEGVRGVSALRPSLPVIIVTGLRVSNGHTQVVAEARAAGARCIILKPVDLRSLCEVMAQTAAGQDCWSEERLELLERAQKYGQGEGQGAEVAPGLYVSSVRRELNELLNATGAAACVVFHLSRSADEVKVLCNVGTPLTGYETHKYTLQKSPISEVIREAQEVFEADVAQHQLRYRHLNLLDYKSCVGVPVQTLGRPEYALFLFHPLSKHFTVSHLHRARVSAKMIGAVITREEAEGLIQRVQPLVFAGQVGSTLVHELNSRLEGITKATTLLKAEYDDIERDPERALDARLRHRVQQRMQELKENDLAARKLMDLFMGLRVKERRRPVRLNESVRRAIGVLAPLAERDRVELLTQLEADLPTTLSVEVWLEQVFINVILNAIQHVAPVRGEGKVVIQTRFLGSGEQLPLQVRLTDNGPGIHGQHLEHVFDLGFSTRPEGTGLGLFTARRLVESLHGRISVDSSVMMVGTTFLVELPLVLPSVDGAA